MAKNSHKIQITHLAYLSLTGRKWAKQKKGKIMGNWNERKRFTGNNIDIQNCSWLCSCASGNAPCIVHRVKDHKITSPITQHSLNHLWQVAIWMYKFRDARRRLRRRFRLAFCLRLLSSTQFVARDRWMWFRWCLWSHQLWSDDSS